MNLKKWRNFMIDEEEVQPEYNPSLSLLNENVFDNLDLTLLSESEIKLLMEGRKENVLKKYGESVEDDAMETIINFDEEYRFKHLNWMASRLSVMDTYSQSEAAEEMVAALSDFVRYGRAMRKKDINQYANLTELLEAIEADIITPRREKAQKARRENPETAAHLRHGAATVIYEDERYFVVRPDSREASCHFGSKTRWCIAQSGNSYFGQYTEGEGKIFYFIKDDTKKNEDANYKMALEITGQGEELYYNTIWDRHDDPSHIDASEPYEIVHVLVDEFDMPEHKADAIVESIVEHAMDNMPESPMAELESKINEGHYDGGFLTMSANLEIDEYTYMYISPEVRITYKITNAKVIEMLDNDEIDISEAEEKIAEALQEDGDLYDKLSEDVDIGASKYWWPSSQYSGNIEIDIREPDAPGSDGWSIVISMDGWMDHDTGGSFHDKGEAESFCDYMQEEWGERNTAEIEESLDNHIYRYFTEFAAMEASAFRNLKAQFINGEHQIDGETLWYTVDDDDDENSDLNLMAVFSHELTSDALDALFNSREITNAAGNKVMVATNNLRAAIHNLQRATSSGGTEVGFLEKAIYNIYMKAREFANRQLKLDFGPDFDTSDQMTFPEIPEGINVNVGLDNASKKKFMDGDNIVPRSAMMQITYSVYIPFHKSEAELSAIMNFILFIRDNYSEISGYIHKYVGQYAGLKRAMTIPDETGMGGERTEVVDIQILKENMYLKIMESQMFLKSLNEDLKKYNKIKKAARYSKS